MAVTNDRKFTSCQVVKILESAKGKKLGEIDHSKQFQRTAKSEKITGIAGDVIEQSLFGFARDSRQECDIEVDGRLVELKTTGVRVPKVNLKQVKGKTLTEKAIFYRAKEGISITAVTFEPDIQRDFSTSHFWEKAERLLLVFYEYESYDVVPASAYAYFPIVGYTFNQFSNEEKNKLKSDWEIVRDYLVKIYDTHSNQTDRYENLVGFTHKLRPELLLIELVPGLKKRSRDSYQKPRYRLKQTFVNSLVEGYFNKTRKSDLFLKDSFRSFAELDKRCNDLTVKYKGKNLIELKSLLNIENNIRDKHYTSMCVLAMFEASCKRLNKIVDFTQAGIIAKCITITPQGARTEDMKLQHIDFDEWCDRDVDFIDSAIYQYFAEHSFLCPIFCERTDSTTFEGFKRFAFDDEFIFNEVKRTWEDSRRLVFRNELRWEYSLDKQGNKKQNESGGYMGAPNFPKSSSYSVFFRGGADVSDDKSRTEMVNGIKMLPQYYWIKGTYIAKKLNSLPYL